MNVFIYSRHARGKLYTRLMVGWLIQIVKAGGRITVQWSDCEGRWSYHSSVVRLCEGWWSYHSSVARLCEGRWSYHSSVVRALVAQARALGLIPSD